MQFEAIWCWNRITFSMKQVTPYLGNSICSIQKSRVLGGHVAGECVKMNDRLLRSDALPI
jgi:hypothetical protein